MNDNAGRHRITRAFSEIAHTLESGDDAAHRITRTLSLLQDLVPYRRCALLSSLSRTSRELYTVPELVTEEEKSALSTRLGSALRATSSVSSAETTPVSDRQPHLTLPVVGLDRVIGVVRVEAAAGTTYDADHVGLLSIVCAQLGAYLTGVQLRDDQSRRLHDLQAAHDFQRLLVGVVGHDLRNPLSVIMAGATVLQHQGLAPESHKDVALRIQKNVRRAARIIDDLLDLTQIQLAGGLQLHRQAVDVGALAEEIAEDAQLATPERRVVADSHGQRVVVECDPERISQVFTNLVGNAVRYGAEGEPVRVDVRAEGDDAVISVRNRGPRISPELLPHIFDPFKRGARGPSTERPAHGLGLGLYIVSEIVRSHGGRIDAQSTPEETSFTVSLPLRTNASARESTPPFSTRRGLT
jgi:K+-sensing histidine kinase KdpD